MEQRQARSCSMTTPMSASHMNLRPVQRVAAAALSLCSFLFCARLAFVLPRTSNEIDRSSVIRLVDQLDLLPGM